MRRRRSSVRVVSAWCVIIALTLPGSLGARVGCDACPPDCPMHAVVTVPEPDALPCHRARHAGGETASATPAASPASPVVRAACGHTEAGDLALQLRHRPPGVAAGLTPGSTPVATPASERPAEPDADVPTRPPKSDRRV